jgi:hypothetical protein
MQWVGGVRQRELDGAYPRIEDLAEVTALLVLPRHRGLAVYRVPCIGGHKSRPDDLAIDALANRGCCSAGHRRSIDLRLIRYGQHWPQHDVTASHQPG